MGEKINQMPHPIPNNSALLRVPGALILGFALLSLPLALNCASSARRPPPVPRVKLVPVMKEFHRLSGEFKRALLIEQRVRFTPLAKGILDQARKLDDLAVTPKFGMYARELLTNAERLASTLPPADLERIDTLFGNLMTSCLSCHHEFRP